MCEVFEGPAVVSMELSWSVQHLLCVFTVYLLPLQPSKGNSESVFQCLSCYNQSSAHSLHSPDQLTGPTSCIRLCLQQRCFGSRSVPHGDVLSVGPYVHNVAVDDLIGSLHTGKPHPQLSACVAASSLQDTVCFSAVQIYTEKRAYTTGTDVTFLAVTKEADPLEFHWQFGDSVTFTTKSRTFIKRFFLPERYNVTVRVSNAFHSVSSEIYPVVIQTAVQPNRLLFMPSVLLDTSVTFTCRIDAGTNVSYLWDFGDGTQRPGHSAEQHLFNRTGEFTVEVTVFNLVSSASLKGHLFIVSEPCQPPPVKNMGPSKIQVWRYQPVSIGVTFESQIECNISSGLLYTWFLYKPTGQQLHIPLVQTNRQSLELPEYLLHYGTYKAVAKVHVVGSIVYSNYSVQIEVMSSLPVIVISGGTNVFINRNNNVITLDGQKSYDPDYPGYAMSYRWKCRPVNSAESSCFRENLPDSSAVLTFPAHALQPDCDLFKFTLTVQSANRSSSSHIFITVRSKPTSFVHISCKECRGNSINWNEPFSVTAVSENCPETVTYSWKLYSVNTSSKTVPEGPFCSSVDISLPSKMEEDKVLFPQSEVTSQTSAVSHPEKISSHYLPNSTGSVLLAQIWNKMSSNSDDLPDTINIYHTTVTRASEVTSTSPLPLLLPNSQPLAGVKESHRSKSRLERSVEHQEGPLTPFDLLSGLESASAAESSGASSEDDYLYAVDTEDENTNKNNVTFKHSSIHGDLDYEYFHSGIEEADAGGPVGRPTGPIGLDDMILHSDEREGDNLVDPSSVGRLVVSEKTLLDLDRELVQPALFQSYIFTGTSSPSITFKPTSLKPESLYMLEVSASFDQALQGKAQLFFNTHSIPEGTACHVQPSTGLEIHTHFSIFCTSGRQDLMYEYSFSVGNSTKKLLYEGRDFQHYFNLPAGDPYNNYEVTIYIEIRNRFGSATKPCPVTVTVQPSFQRTPSSNPDQELFVYGLGNLTSLMLMRNSRDIINHIYLLTVVLNRLSLDTKSSMKLQTDTRADLISAVCQLTVSSKVTFDSAILVTKYVHHVSSLRETNLPANHILDVNVVKAVVFVLSNILDAPIPSSRPGIQLTQHVLHIITNSVLMFMHSSKDPQFSVNTTTMNLIAWQHYGSPPTVKTLHTTTFYIPDLLDMHNKQGRNADEQSSCFITQLVSYRQNPYHWTRTPAQLNGDVAEVKLFNCTGRKEIRWRYLSTPVVVEFQKHDEINKSRNMKFTLARSEVNIHLFSITPELLQKTIELRVEFSRPTRRAFPVMLLLRMHKKPTLTLYNIQKVYHWKETMAQIFLPPLSLKDAGTAYLMLLNADYNKSPINKYTANAVNYTLSIESIQCLAWDGLREWRPDSCSVLKGFSTTRINCSCSRLTSFTVTHQTIYSNYSVTNITEYTSARSSLTLYILIAVSAAMYAVLLVFCKHADVRTEKSSGSFLLPDNDPSDQFLYAVTIHTGLRSRASMTAKVYIILYGENGASQTRELSSSDHKLFTSNSTNTFILSTPCSLGQVWQVHLWHDASGSSPSWFLSRVLVKDLLQGCSWIFQAQCWLAVDEGDGRVERRLQALEQKLTFREVAMLYLKLKECLEDFHPWLSVYSRPSYSTHTHTQRFSVCFLLLQAYMCANTVLIYLQEEQYSSELGLIGVSPVSVVTGLCALTVVPVGILASYLFRISKTNKSRNKSGEQYKVRLPHVYTVEVSATDFCSSFKVIVGLSVASLSCPLFALMLTFDRQPYLSGAWVGIQDWKYNHDSTWVTCNKLASDSKLQRTTDSSSCIEIIEENIPEIKDSSKNHPSCGSRTNTLQVWCYYATWAVWLCLCLTFMIITAILGLKFNSTKSLLWIQSVFFSLLFCAFAIHPAMILIVAICATLRCKELSYFYQSSAFDEPVTELLKQNKQSRVCFHKHFTSCSHHQPEEISMYYEKVLASRQRERYLRLARPPTSTQLKCVRRQIRKRTLIKKTIRSEVSRTLQKLSATSWTDRNTKAMIVQFTLYSPAYNLFTTVTMLEEQPPIGGFQPTVFVHSTQLYNSATALDYWLMAAELLFLLLTLLQLYIQICVMAQKALLYWTNLWNWLEVVSLLISFLSFICAVQHFTLRTDTIEHLQREDFKKFVDMSPVSSWEQFSRSLHGILVFLLLMKCCFMLRINEVMTAAVSSMALIFSNLLWPLIAGVILIIAFSCLGNLLFHSNASVFRTLPRSVYWIISHCFGWGRLRYLWGLDHKTQASLVLYVYGALLCTVSVAFKAVVTGAVTSFVKKAAKSQRRKPHLSVSDLLTYTRDVALVLIGKGRQNWMDNHDNANNLYLEEFEELVDELLLRLNVISNSDTLEEQENHKNQRCLSFEHDYSSEVTIVTLIILNSLFPIHCS
ncbi:polycystic kidney disease 1 like 1 [Colossoma macropomum]|uniref:polycystic kidney disease 1 like 1 n=1 Tax=Colossoma macropomum TaxID=42526 RepID=UPI00186451FB|nr:polycystic kidney disease 1 like 1 [Colossoma macropomum]